MGPEDSACSNLRIESERADKSGSDNHLFSHPRDINCSEGNKHPHILPEPSGSSGRSEHLETHAEVPAEIGCSDYFDINPEVIGGNKSRNHPEVVDGSGGHEHMVMHPDNPFYQNDIFSPNKKLRSTSSSSSSVSLEDLYQVDTNAEEGTQPASKDDRNDVFSSNTFNSSEIKNASPCPTSTCQVSQVTHELTTQTPPIQMMDRSGGYDPLRIISSSIVRSGKSATPLDWSAASNDSLFSIQIGNNSFSREVMLGTDLFKSEELPKSNELLMFSPTHEGIKDMTRATAESQSKEKPPPAEVPSHSYSISNGSVTSSCSFAFPILTDCLNNASVKVNTEKQQQQSMASEVTSKATGCNWLCSCSPRPSRCRCCRCHC